MFTQRVKRCQCYFVIRTANLKEMRFIFVLCAESTLAFLPGASQCCKSYFQTESDLTSTPNMQDYSKSARTQRCLTLIWLLFIWSRDDNEKKKSILKHFTGRVEGVNGGATIEYVYTLIIVVAIRRRWFQSRWMLLTFTILVDGRGHHSDTVM